MTAPTRTTIWILAFVTGIGMGAGQASHPSIWAWLGAAVITLLGFRPRVPAVLVAVGGLAAGFLYVGQWRGGSHVRWEFGRESAVAGTVVAPPDRRPTKTLLTILPDGSSGAKILVSAGRYPVYAYGDRIRVVGIIERPEAFSGFDYPAYLEKDRVYGTVGKPKKVELLGHGGGNPVLSALYGLRGRIEETVQKAIPEPEAGFLNGIMLGSKRALPDDLSQALQNTGTSHIIAISGANITILLDILLGILPLYTLRRQFWSTVLIAAFMCLLTGASASVVRGALIASLGRWARMHSRRAWTLPLILSGMAAMLLESPLLLIADPGFQLSFAAFAGLGWLGTPCAAWIDRMFPRWPEAVRDSLAETVAASLGTAPVSFALFGQLSLLGFVVNPLILWLLPTVTLMGLGLCAFGWVPGVIPILQFPLWLCLRGILATIAWFGSLDIGLIHWKIPWSASLGLWGAGGLAFILIRNRHRHAPP